jgi:hypothetical protein
MFDALFEDPFSPWPLRLLSLGAFAGLWAFGGVVVALRRRGRGRLNLVVALALGAALTVAFAMPAVPIHGIVAPALICTSAVAIALFVAYAIAVLAEPPAGQRVAASWWSAARTVARTLVGALISALLIPMWELYLALVFGIDSL